MHATEANEVAVRAADATISLNDASLSQHPATVRDRHRPVPALSIHHAAVEAHEALLMWRAGVEADARLREPVRVVDSLLTRVEESNLAGHGAVAGVHVRLWIRELARALGRPLPIGVRRAHTGYAFHAALLDWQEQLLDEAMPPGRESAEGHQPDATAPPCRGVGAPQLFVVDRKAARMVVEHVDAYARSPCRRREGDQASTTN